jgi:signal peptidase I
MRGHLKPRKLAGNLGVLALLGIWFVTVAPTAIGGPAAYIEVSGHSMDGTYRTGDLVVTRQQDSYAKGDIVAFKAGSGQVIHRIIGGNGTKGYTLQGDNNPDPDPWHPTDADVVGKAWIHLPDKAWVLHLPRNPTFAGVTAGLLTTLVLLWDERPWRRREEYDDSVAPVPAQRTPTEETSRPTVGVTR